ncbi:MAG TPA: nucleotidyl transferase AbiEii/AbiGii toxin family protein [Rhodanobacteraceae bacterium]|nr:nucleotidyl transferase AbiEii/AbiGii toxin family protein [Rhodanobacteraceae bacterium]
MTGVFTPRFDILPPAQRWLWPNLAGATKLGFVLYGGTAIALRLGHRTSVDFDFFTSRALDRATIVKTLPWTGEATVLQDAPDTLTVLAAGGDNMNDTVKVSFFGIPGFGRIAAPDATMDGVLRVAALADLMATKLKVILQRAEAKDYRDIAAMLRAGSSLPDGLAGARALFGASFQPSEALKALVYFKDGDLSDLSTNDKTLLVQAASTVQDVPSIHILAPEPDA